MNWKRWNWLDDGVLPLLVAVLRASWIWPWLLLAQRMVAPSYTGSPLPLALVIGIPLASLMLTRFLASDATGAGAAIPWRSRLAVAVGGLATILHSLWWQFYRGEIEVWDTAWLARLGEALTHWGEELPVPVLVLLVLIYLWLRGVLDADQVTSHDEVWRVFVAGLAAWVAYMAVTAAMGGSVALGTILWLLLFFGAGMAALAFANLKVASSLGLALGVGTRQDRVQIQANRYWLLSVAVLIVLLLSVALFLGFLVAPEDVARLLAWAGTVLGLIGRAVSYVILGVSYVLAMVAYGVFLLLQPLFRWLQGLMDTDQESQEFEAPEPFATPEPLATTPAEIPEPFRWIGLAIFVLVVLVIFALALRRLRSRTADEIEEVRESVFSSDLLWDQLSGLWRDWLGRLRAFSGGVLDPFLPLAGEIGTRQAIRRVYRQLLIAGRTIDQPRLRDQTPLEYQQRLQAGVEGMDPLLDTITAGYMLARYAPDPPTEEDAARVHRAWDEIRTRFVDLSDDPDGEEAKPDR